MALRLLDEIANDARTRIAKVYRDTEWQEYRVKFTQDGARLPDADYHTTDRDDATHTARAWAWSARFIA